jgi:hypothetical protein
MYNKFLFHQCLDKFQFCDILYVPKFNQFSTLKSFS